MVQAMDQEVLKRTCKLWIREQLKEILMVQAMDGAIYGTSDGSRSCRRRYMDQEVVEGAVDGASDGMSDSGSRSSRRRYGSGSCRRCDQDAVEASIDVTGRKLMMMIG